MRTRGRDRSRETEAESHQISHRFKRMKTTWRNQEKAKGKMEEKKYLKWYNKVGGYLIFAVPGTAKISDAGLHTVVDWIVCSNLRNCYRMSSE